MIWINYGTWGLHKFSDRFNMTWTWKRYYKNGHRWTPIIYLEVKKKYNESNLGI